jgi:hypothetical protein
MFTQDGTKVDTRKRKWPLRLKPLIDLCQRKDAINTHIQKCTTNKYNSIESNKNFQDENRTHSSFAATFHYFFH